MNQPIQATTRRRRDTQVRLMHAAHQVIVSQGMAKTTVEAICDNAGFTRGALYSNFADLDDLLTSMLSYEYSLILNGIEIFREQKRTHFTSLWTSTITYHRKNV